MTGLPVRLSLLILFLAPVAGDEPPLSPVNLGWLRDACGDGALAHHAAGRIYLTELATGQTVFVANGNQPEFSPDSSKLAWIDGRTAKGRERRNTSIHLIAQDVEPSGGVHWLNDDEVLLVLDRNVGKRWYRVSLDGEEIEVPALTRLGTGGYECDVRLAEDGVWSYVAKRPWRTSDGRRGVLPGTCSVSLSLDGRSATSLHNPHKECPITAIRPGGYEATLWWRWRGGFDNHRFASNDPRFIVCVDEHTDTMVVTTLDGRQCTRMGNLGRSDSGMYGDFTVGDGRGAPWPTRSARAHPHATRSWPPDRRGLVFVWENGAESNTIAVAGNEVRLCRLIPRGRARPARFFDLNLAGGWALLEEKMDAAIASALRESGELSLEAIITPEATQTGTVLAWTDGTSSDLALDQRGNQLFLRLRTRFKMDERQSGAIPIGTVRPGEPHHVLITYATDDLRTYLDGKKTAQTTRVRGHLRVGSDLRLHWGAGAEGRNDWRGRVEGIACYSRLLGPPEAQRHHAAYAPRLGDRSPVPRFTLLGTLERKLEIPEATAYPQLLVVYSYRVAGGRDRDRLPGRIRVAHWGTLNGAVRAPIRDRSVGNDYPLLLERFEDHPELAALQILLGDEEIEGPLFYAVKEVVERPESP